MATPLLTIIICSDRVPVHPMPAWNEIVIFLWFYHSLSWLICYAAFNSAPSIPLYFFPLRGLKSTFSRERDDDDEAFLKIARSSLDSLTRKTFICCSLLAVRLKTLPDGEGVHPPPPAASHRSPALPLPPHPSSLRPPQPSAGFHWLPHASRCPLPKVAARASNFSRVTPRNENRVGALSQGKSSGTVKWRCYCLANQSNLFTLMSIGVK